MSEMVRRIEGWTFQTVEGDDEPRILDVEIARIVKMGTPRNIRKTIKRWSEGPKPFLSAKNLRALEARKLIPGGYGATREENVTEYWLDEVGAIKLLTKLETPTAHEMVEYVINVFRAAASEFRREYEQSFANRVLLFKRRDWQRCYERELGQEICKLYGYAWNGEGTQPVMLAGVWERIYRAVLSDATYEEMKVRNPCPQKDSNHHQFLTEDAIQVFKTSLMIVKVLAGQSGSAPEFWERINREYRRGQLQCTLNYSTPIRKLAGVKKAMPRNALVTLPLRSTGGGAR